MEIEDLRKHLGGKYDDKVITQILQSPFLESNTPISFREWKQSFVGAFLCKTPERIHVLKYIAAAIEKEQIEWSDFTTSNLTRIRDYIADTVSANSASVYLNIIKALLNENKDNPSLPNSNFGKLLTVRKEPSQNVALSAEEIALIEKYVPNNMHERAVKAQFLCEYYSLCRSSDLMLMTPNNFVDGKITYVSKKTRVETSLPMHKNFMKYYKQMGKTYSKASYGRIIKRICKNVGIDEPVKLYYRGKIRTLPKYEFIQSHTARRSGATELARRNVPISVISRLMNHDGRISTTERYIISDTKNLCEEAMSFFNGQ